VLTDEPVFKWLITIGAAILTLLGATLVYVGFKPAATIAGFLALVAPAVVLVIVGSSNWSPWWDSYDALPNRDQWLLTSGIGFYIATLLIAALVGIFGWSRRRQETQDAAHAS
jgi:hypothetical protein